MKKKRIVTILAACLTFVMIGALSACAGERGPQGEKANREYKVFRAKREKTA